MRFFTLCLGVTKMLMTQTRWQRSLHIPFLIKLSLLDSRYFIIIYIYHTPIWDYPIRILVWLDPTKRCKVWNNAFSGTYLLESIAGWATRVDLLQLCGCGCACLWASPEKNSLLSVVANWYFNNLNNIHLRLTYTCTSEGQLSPRLLICQLPISHFIVGLHYPHIHNDLQPDNITRKNNKFLS